tara:strand:- start:436 stop:1719 length:1284 start_codon:yes stop_codon:yes gene_type:complete
MKKDKSSNDLIRSVNIEIPKKALDQAINEKLISIGKKAKIKGFRPGKIPNSVLKKHYGAEAYQDAISDLLQKGYAEAINDGGHKPVSSPDIKPLKGDDENLKFSASFEILPEIKLKNLDKIKINKPEIDISDNDLDQMMEKLRKQKRKWKKISSKSKKGDQININFTGKLNGELFEGGEGKDVPVVLGEGQMIPEFEKALFDLKSGENKTIKVKFPKEYHSTDLANKKVDFDLTVNSVSEEVLPDLDQEFVKSFGIEDGDLKRLKQDVKQNMEREVKQKITQDIKSQVMEGLLDKNKIQIPNSMKKNEILNMQKESMRQMGIEEEKEMPPAENFSEMAEKRVKIGLLVSQFIEDNSIKVDMNKVKDRIKEMCAGYQEPDAMIEQYMGNQQAMSQIQSIVLEEQAIDLISSMGKEKIKKISFNEYMNG